MYLFRERHEFSVLYTVLALYYAFIADSGIDVFIIVIITRNLAAFLVVIDM